MRRALALLALALAAAAAQGQELGRLFFTPEQRAALDARRRAHMPDSAASAVAAPLTRVDGFVKRSAGPSTIWINGEWTTESSPEAPRIAEPSPSVSVSAGETGGRVRLKPGETLDRGSGEVRDVIGDGDIQVRHKDPGK
jgi:hypothetical protein